MQENKLLRNVSRRLLQQVKDSPSKMDQNGVKVQAANDAVQAIKQLRKEIVAIMSQLLCLAKSKNSKGMLPLCNEMVTKTRVLLNIWEPSLVEEAFEFIENHRTVEEPDNFTIVRKTKKNSFEFFTHFQTVVFQPMSPFKKITQQLGALDLKSPDLEDFATPMSTAPPDLWPSMNPSKNLSHNFKTKSPSSTDINAIATIQNTVKTYQNQTSYRPMSSSSSSERMSYSLPVETNVSSSIDTDGIKFNETHFDVNGDIVASVDLPTNLTKPTAICDKRDSESIENSFAQQFVESRNEILHNSNEFDDNGQNCSIILGHNGAFLDAKVCTPRCLSPFLDQSKTIC